MRHSRAAAGRFETGSLRHRAQASRLNMYCIFGLHRDAVKVAAELFALYALIQPPWSPSDEAMVTLALVIKCRAELLTRLFEEAEETFADIRRAAPHTIAAPDALREIAASLRAITAHGYAVDVANESGRVADLGRLAAREVDAVCIAADLLDGFRRSALWQVYDNADAPAAKTRRMPRS